MTKGTKADFAIIKQVQEIRAKNNVAWMNIVRVGLTAAPRKTRALLAEITNNDAMVNVLMKELSNGGKG